MLTYILEAEGTPPLQLLPAEAAIAGWVFPPLRSCAFSRRTEKCGLETYYDMTHEEPKEEPRAESCDRTAQTPQHDAEDCL